MVGGLLTCRYTPHPQSLSIGVCVAKAQPGATCHLGGLWPELSPSGREYLGAPPGAPNNLGDPTRALDPCLSLPACTSAEQGLDRAPSWHRGVADVEDVGVGDE